MFHCTVYVNIVLLSYSEDFFLQDVCMYVFFVSFRHIHGLLDLQGGVYIFPKLKQNSSIQRNHLALMPLICHLMGARKPAFSMAAAALQNALPFDVCQTSTLLAFSRALKIWLFLQTLGEDQIATPLKFDLAAGFCCI